MLSDFGYEINGQKAMTYPLRVYFTAPLVKKTNVNNEVSLAGNPWY